MKRVAILAAMVVVLGGCGGGSSSGPAQYSGTYTGPWVVHTRIPTIGSTNEIPVTFQIGVDGRVTGGVPGNVSPIPCTFSNPPAFLQGNSFTTTSAGVCAGTFSNSGTVTCNATLAVDGTVTGLTLSGTITERVNCNKGVAFTITGGYSAFKQ